MTRVLFIADQTAASTRTPDAGYPGGAELTDQAAIEACPWPVEVMVTDDVEPRHLDDFDLHIIGNLGFAKSRASLFNAFHRLGRHILFEHDVRMCLWRGTFPKSFEYFHRHDHRCVCPHPHLRDLYRSALGTLFLTHRQREHCRRNPFFEAPRSLVIGSSLMNEAFFERVERFREDPPPIEHQMTIAYSSCPRKGYEEALAYCRRQGVDDPMVIRDLDPPEVLEVLERSKRFVFLPKGLEPGGRMLLEARFLGCHIVGNRTIGVSGESWWRLDDDQALAVVRDAPHRFWRLVEELRRGAGDADDQRTGPSAPTTRRWERAVGPAAVGLMGAAERLLLTAPAFKKMTSRGRRRRHAPLEVHRTSVKQPSS